MVLLLTMYIYCYYYYYFFQEDMCKLGLWAFTNSSFCVHTKTPRNILHNITYFTFSLAGIITLLFVSSHRFTHPNSTAFVTLWNVAVVPDIIYSLSLVHVPNRCESCEKDEGFKKRHYKALLYRVDIVAPSLQTMDMHKDVGIYMHNYWKPLCSCCLFSKA